MENLKNYFLLMRLDKPIGTLLLLWPMLCALWLASSGQPDFLILSVFVLGTFLMRSAGCVINDIADRNFDGFVERTKNRVLASKKVSVKEALFVFAVLALVAFFLVLILNNLLVLLLSCVALFLAITYPFTKRFFPLPQAYLGVAYGFGIPMAFAAAQNAVPLPCWLLLLANVFWSLAYDTEYAMVDKPYDLKIGIQTSAITFGRFDVLAVMICYFLHFALFAFVVFYFYNMQIFTLLGVLLAMAIALLHYFWIKNRNPAQCFRAFLNNNYVGMSLFLGIFLDFCFFK